ncbi:MAG TPA: ABC transporter permease [Pyrinomonadaceae bacterium]|jgi:ABC-type multidrug transport system permease subunit
MKAEPSAADENETERGGQSAAPTQPAGQKDARLHPLIQLTGARVREFIREPEALFWGIVFPVLLAFALGIAFRSTGAEKVRVAVERASGGSTDGGMSRIERAFARSTEIEAVSLSKEEAARALRSGRVALVVRPAETKARAARGEGDADITDDGMQPWFDYLYDPTRPESRTARLTIDDALQRDFGRRDAVQVPEERVTEPGARYIDFLVPGLLGLNLMGSGLWGVGFAVVTSRMQKLLKRLAVTPMKHSHYLLSFVFSRLIFLVLEVTALIIFARLAFGYMVRGSLFEMTLLLLTGALAFSGVGLMLASRASTIEGISGLLNVVMMPMWLLSGTFFSSERFPGFLQPFIKALPLTAMNDALRSVMNEGAALSANLTPLCILLAWGILSFIVALRIFRWQ